MDTGFKNEIRQTKDKKMKSPWDFTSPAYDQRTSCFISAGSHHGVGKKNAVGHEGSSRSSDVIPKGRVNTLQVMSVPYDRLDEQ